MSESEPSEDPDVPEVSDVSGDAQSPESDEGGAVAKPGMSMSLKVLFAILGIMIVLYMFDRNSLGKATEARDKIVAAIDEKEDSTDADIQALLGRAPDKAYKASTDWIEEYRWQGGLRKHTVYVNYSPGDPKYFLSVTVNVPIK